MEPTPLDKFLDALRMRDEDTALELYRLFEFQPHSIYDQNMRSKLRRTRYTKFDEFRVRQALNERSTGLRIAGNVIDMWWYWSRRRLGYIYVFGDEDIPLADLKKIVHG